MSRTQRFVMLGLAAIVAIFAIVVLPGGDDNNDRPQRATQAEPPSDPPASTPPTSGGERAPAPDPKPKPPLLKAGEERELAFTKGETVRFRVRHSGPEEVHVHGYDITRELEPGKTEIVSFKADLEGIFEVELEQSGTELGTIKVEPK
jgi:hypothetical protein